MIDKKIYESDVESALIRRVNSLGGFCEKFMAMGRISAPDRIVTLPGGKIVFVECKRPGYKPSPAQLHDHERRRNLGCTVFVIDSIEDAKNFNG
jgi:hypothetical protein